MRSVVAETFSSSPRGRGLGEHGDREVAAPVALAAAAAEVARPVAAVGAADALRLGHVDAVGGHLLVRRGELDDLVADGPGDQVARRALDRLRHDDARRRLALVGRRGVEEPARVRRQERDVAERVGAEVPARHGAAPVEVDLPDAQPRRVGEDHARRLRVLVEALADARRRHRDVAERRQGLQRQLHGVARRVRRDGRRRPGPVLVGAEAQRERAQAVLPWTWPLASPAESRSSASSTPTLRTSARGRPAAR